MKLLQQEGNKFPLDAFQFVSNTRSKFNTSLMANNRILRNTEGKAKRRFQCKHDPEN
jgi:hypothetical protein